MYFAAEIGMNYQETCWAEHLLVQAPNAEAAHVIASQQAQQRAQRSAASCQVAGVSLRPLGRLEFQTLASFWETVVAPGSMEPAIEMDLALPDYLQRLAGHVHDALVLQGVTVDMKPVQQALWAALAEVDWPSLAAALPDWVPDGAVPERPERPATPAPREARYGPRLLATFIPQAWENNAVVELPGRCPVDVTSAVLALPLARLHGLEDYDLSAEVLVDVMDIGHYGPFAVEVEAALQAFFEVESLPDITSDMLERARERAWHDRDVSVGPEPQRHFDQAAPPYSIAELEHQQWKVDCVVGLPLDLENRGAETTAWLSSRITGHPDALTVTALAPYGSTQNGHIPLRVKGRVVEPERHFAYAKSVVSCADSTSLRRLLSVLNRSDVFEMEWDGHSTRYRIVYQNLERIGWLTQLSRISRSDWDNRAGAGVVEFLDAQAPLTDAGGNWFSLEELATARYLDDGSFQLTVMKKVVLLRFF